MPASRPGGRSMAVAWTNEEGSRFQPGAMGSAVFAGHNKLDEMLQVKDWKGVVLKDALAETLKAAPAPLRDGQPGFPLDFYVEAHIEQGPRLENEKQDHRRRHRHPGQPPLHRRDHGRGGACRHDAARRPQGCLRGGAAHRRRRCTRRRPTRTTRCASPSAASTCRPARPTRCRARRSSPSTCAIPTTPCWKRTRRS